MIEKIAQQEFWLNVSDEYEAKANADEFCIGHKLAHVLSVSFWENLLEAYTQPHTSPYFCLAYPDFYELWLDRTNHAKIKHWAEVYTKLYPNLNIELCPHNGYLFYARKSLESFKAYKVEFIKWVIQNLNHNIIEPN